MKHLITHTPLQVSGLMRLQAEYDTSTVKIPLHAGFIRGFRLHATTGILKAHDATLAGSPVGCNSQSQWVGSLSLALRRSRSRILWAKGVQLGRSLASACMPSEPHQQGLLLRLLAGPLLPKPGAWRGLAGRAGAAAEHPQAGLAGAAEGRSGGGLHVTGLGPRCRVRAAKEGACGAPACHIVGVNWNKREGRWRASVTHERAGSRCDFDHRRGSRRQSMPDDAILWLP